MVKAWTQHEAFDANALILTDTLIEQLTVNVHIAVVLGTPPIKFS